MMVLFRVPSEDQQTTRDVHARSQPHRLIRSPPYPLQTRNRYHGSASGEIQTELINTLHRRISSQKSHYHSPGQNLVAENENTARVPNPLLQGRHHGLGNSAEIGEGAIERSALTTEVVGKMITQIMLEAEAEISAWTRAR